MAKITGSGEVAEPAPLPLPASLSPLTEPSVSPVASGWDRFYAGLLTQRRHGAFDLAVLPRLRRARERMLEASEERLDLAAMARPAHFSKYHFLRLFRQAY